MFDFERFPVYQKSACLYQKIHRIISTSKNFPLVNQINRASISISLNIAEGAGKYSKKDKVRFYVIARGSLQETVACLELFHLTGDLDESKHEELYNELETISRMLSGLIKSLR